MRTQVHAGRKERSSQKMRVQFHAGRKERKEKNMRAQVHAGQKERKEKSIRLRIPRVSLPLRLRSYRTIAMASECVPQQRGSCKSSEKTADLRSGL